MTAEQALKIVLALRRVIRQELRDASPYGDFTPVSAVASANNQLTEAIQEGFSVQRAQTNT